MSVEKSPYSQLRKPKPGKKPLGKADSALVAKAQLLWQVQGI
jgi:hypothetical protein